MQPVVQFGSVADEAQAFLRHDAQLDHSAAGAAAQLALPSASVRSQQRESLPRAPATTERAPTPLPTKHLITLLGIIRLERHPAYRHLPLEPDAVQQFARLSTARGIATRRQRFRLLEPLHTKPRGR